MSAGQTPQRAGSRNRLSGAAAVTPLMLWLPLALLAVALLLEYSGADLRWESLFFQSDTQQWPLRHNRLFVLLFHSGGRLIDGAALVLWLVVFAAVTLRPGLRRHTKYMLFLLAACASGPIVVGALKATTHIYSPWNLQIFGGSQPYLRVFDAAPAGAAIGHAFPAGHASGGYGLFGLYFALVYSRSRYRTAVLVAAIVLGVTFGLSQQMRGAHFPSHDLFTLVLCWYAALGTWRVFALVERGRLPLRFVAGLRPGGGDVISRGESGGGVRAH